MTEIMQILDRQIKLKYINAHLHSLVVHGSMAAKDLYDKNESEINEIEDKINGGHHEH